MSARCLPLLVLLAPLAGCGSDDDSTTLLTATGTDTDLTTTGATSTGAADPGTTGEAPEPVIDCPAFTPPQATFTAPPPDTQALDSCDPDLTNVPMGALVEVYYPGDENEDPADGRFPVVVFHHGNGLDYQEYDYLIEHLQELGFVVLNVSADPVFDPEVSFSVLGAIDSMRCALRWFYLESSYYEDVGSCELVTAGHSRGGTSAQILHLALSDPDTESELQDLHLRAMVLLASYAPGSLPSLQEYGPDQAIPLLAIGSSNDDDVPGQVLTAYDRMVPEPTIADLLSPLLTPYKGQVWVYDLPHAAFGGASLGGGIGGTLNRLPGSVYEDKGHTITNAYVGRFLRWQVFGEDQLRPFFVGSALPPEVEEPGWWAHLPAYRGAPDVCDGIGSSTQCEDLGCEWTAMGCEGTPSCDSFDTEEDCFDAECQWDPIPLPAGECVGRVPILLSYTIGDGLRYLAEVFEHDDASMISADAAIDTDLGPVAQIIQGVELDTGHDTSGLLARVTSQSPGASVSFSTQPPSLAAMQYASMRVGVRTRIDLEGQPPNVTVCEAGHVDDVPLIVQVSDGDSQSAQVALQPLLQQDAVITYVLESTVQAHCEPQLFLETQRVPMADLCEGAMLDVSNLESWTFSFPEGVPERDEVVFDSLELTTLSNGDAGVGQCPVQTALWGCEASSSLTPQRPTCTVEPQNGNCPSQSVVYESLDVPVVPQPWGGTFDGWVVNMPPGFSDDPWNPTSELDDAMSARCIAACEKHYSGDPTVDVDCDDPQAFDDVWLISTPADGALRRISPRRVDGSGLFEGESLSCSLLDSCCTAFDEDVCPATPRRTTPAAYPLGIGQEYVVDLDASQSTLEVSDGFTTDSVELTGDIGFSRCRDGNDDAACPFYLGSVTAKSSGSIVIPVTCPNQQVVNRTLYNLEVELAQPAMGMAQEGTDEVGFPAGALVFEASFMQNATPMTARGVNQVDVVGAAGETSFEFGDIVVFGQMPACWGQDDIPVAGTFELVLDLTGGVQESPPSIEIDIPSTVACPILVDLDAAASDPDGDLDIVRWYIDDVLIDASTTAVTFSEPHLVRAVAYDERGAATTDVKVVSCQ